MVHLEDKTSTELARLAAADRTYFKPVSSALEPRDPCAAAAGVLVDAYAGGEAPAWLVAQLLGQNGHPDGYETAKAILLSGARQLSESCAGAAMARIRGDEALADLTHIMRTGKDRHVRDGAVYGIALVADRQAFADVIATLREWTISVQAATSVLDRIEPTESELLALLRDSDVRVGRLAAYHLHRRRAYDPPPPPPSPEVQEAVLALDFNDGMKQRLRAWFMSAG